MYEKKYLDGHILYVSILEYERSVKYNFSKSDILFDGLIDII